ncbi:hypothetical protein [Streptomyces sp. NBC_01236]|uniref:hypothetical protein n=1 Tax=Streptomyces sp. NBC_01236 TaxID=2903789 RepID=UPI002E1654DC|nr:hypothetical protein OG324_51355 [Streptomyces sp. NBC_01236]
MPSSRVTGSLATYITTYVSRLRPAASAVLAGPHTACGMARALAVPSMSAWASWWASARP